VSEAMTEGITVERTGEVAAVRMRAGENRFNPDNLDAIDAALDEVEGAYGGPSPLVITGEGRFFSNGLDLDWMSQAPAGEPVRVLDRVHALFARLLAFPSFTVAAVNGHAFAAGAMLALACDARVMRADRGFFCLPEVDIRIPFSPGMSALIAAKLPAAVAHEAMITGRRYGGTDAAAVGIVHEAAAEGEVLERARARAAAVGVKSPETMRAIKRGLFEHAIDRLGGGPGGEGRP
jgi:enoyl-CoA hydratase/carnithine racemase